MERRPYDTELVLDGRESAKRDPKKTCLGNQLYPRTAKASTLPPTDRRFLEVFHNAMSTATSETPSPREELEELGYDIVYKPHETMAAYNAFYRVEYEGQEIAPPAARRMGVPLNEVWLTEFLRPYENYVLYHELNEIEYRAEGYGVDEAHQKALEDDRIWEGDPKWEELQREINLVSLRRVAALPGFGETLFERIQRNRPYCDMRELREVEGIGRTRYEQLSEAFWCFDCDL